MIVEQRADGKVETEATIKIWVDGERYVRTAEGNGPVNALDTRAARRRSARSTRTCKDIELVNFKVRILDETKGTGAVTRVLLDASDGTRRLGLDRRLENVIAASWQALVDSLEYGMQPGRRPPGARSVRRAHSELIPLARPVLGDARGGARSSRSCARASCRWARRLPAFEQAFAARLGARARQRRVQRHRRPAPRAARGRGDATATRSSHRRSRSSPAPTPSLFERARPVFADIDPVHAQPRPRGRRAPRSPSARRRCCRSHIFGYPADLPAFERLGLPIVEDACEALGAVHADGTPVGGRGHPAVFGFYANKQLTTGEGGMVTIGDAGGQGAHRLRAQPGPRARHGLARPRPPRLQLPPLRHRLRDRARPARAPRRDARRPRARRRAVPRGAGGHRGPRACRARTRGGDRRGWFVFVVQLPARRRPRRRRSARCASAASQSKPYLPAIHLMSFYRERFGHREGEFPVCEDVAARSLALPFFPELTEGAGRTSVAEALRAGPRPR